MKELIKNIEQWAAEKNLLHPENAPKQYLKFIEECGEAAKEILKNNPDGIKDEFGDIAVTVIILAKQLGVKMSGICYTDKHTSFSWFMSEVSENSISKFTIDCINDVSTHYGFTIEECLQFAWNKIKDRQGETINGTFVKTQENCL